MNKGDESLELEPSDFSPSQGLPIRIMHKVMEKTVWVIRYYLVLTNLQTDL